MEGVIEVLEKCRDYRSHKPNSLGFLTGVAGIRFAISEIASIHHHLFSVRDAGVSQDIQRLVSRLMQQAQGVCISTTNLNDLVGAVAFLLKMIVRQFGFPCLKYVSEQYEWIIPVSLRTKDEVCACVKVTAIS